MIITVYFSAPIVLFCYLKSWRDLEFKETVNKKVDTLLAKYDSSSKEIEALLIEIEKNTKTTEFVLEYLKKIGPNASRLGQYSGRPIYVESYRNG